MRRKLGKLIVIDGIDQAGKKTQAQMLTKKLHALRYKSWNWSFPDYKTPIGSELRKYLAGKNRFNFHTVHMLYAANRWERADSIARQIISGGIVVVNRYMSSNLAYGIAHGLQADWIESLEKGLPKASLVLILDVSPRASFRRKKRLRDVHEENLHYLAKVRTAYLRLAKKYGWKVVDGERDPKDVHLELWRYILPTLRSKSGP
jgi:dTMP kinase